MTNTTKTYEITWHLQKDEPIVEVTLTAPDGRMTTFVMEAELAQCFGQGVQFSAEEAFAAVEAVKAVRAARQVAR